MEPRVKLTKAITSSNFYSKCLVCGASDKENPALSFFRLPNTQPERRNWLLVSNHTEETLPSKPVICSQHCLNVCSEPETGTEQPRKKLFRVVRDLNTGKHFSVDIYDSGDKQSFESMAQREKDAMASKRSSTEDMELPSMDQDLDDMMAEIYNHDGTVEMDKVEECSDDESDDGTAYVSDIIEEIIRNVIESQGGEMEEVIEISENEEEIHSNKRHSTTPDDDTPLLKKTRLNGEEDEDIVDTVLDEFFSELTSGSEDLNEMAGDTSDGDDVELHEAYDAEDADDDCELLMAPLQPPTADKATKRDCKKVISDIMSESTKLQALIRRRGNKAKVPIDLLKDFKDSFKAMVQADIEDLVLQKVIELNDLQVRCKNQEELIESYRETLNKLASHCQDLELKSEEVCSEFEAYKLANPPKLGQATVGTQTLKEETPKLPLKVVGLDKLQTPVAKQTSTQSNKTVMAASKAQVLLSNQNLTIKKIANLPLKTTVTAVPKSATTEQRQSMAQATAAQQSVIYVSNDTAQATVSNLPNKTAGTTIYNNSIVKNGNSMIYVLPQQQPVPGIGANIMLSPQTPLISGQQLQQILQLQQQQQTKQLPVLQPNTTAKVLQTSQIVKKLPVLKHPAPPPAQHYQISDPSWKSVPPQPIVRIKKLPTGIVISWTMPNLLTEYADIACYQLYAYEETHHMPTTDNWRYVGDVKAMLLPIAVTLVQFQEGQRYHFVVRAVDKHNRVGIFSEPQTWKDAA